MRWINSTNYDVKVEMVNEDLGHEDFWQTETIVLKPNDSIDENYGFYLNQDFILVMQNGFFLDKDAECIEQDAQMGYIVLTR